MQYSLLVRLERFEERSIDYCIIPCIDVGNDFFYRGVVVGDLCSLGVCQVVRLVLAAYSLLRSSQNATDAAAATFSESTLCDIGIFTV